VARRKCVNCLRAGLYSKTKWRLKLYKDEQFLMEIGMEFHVARTKQTKVPKMAKVTKIKLDGLQCI